MKYLPIKLKECREKANISIDTLMIKLANVGLTVHTNTLRNWESGKQEPDPSDLVVIASFYQKPIQYFFDQKAKLSV